MVNFLANALDACHMDRTKKDHTITFHDRRLGGRLCLKSQPTVSGWEQETKETTCSPCIFLLEGIRGTGNRLFVSNHVITIITGISRGIRIRPQRARIQVEIPGKATPSPPSIGYSEGSERHVLGAELH